MVHQRHGHLSQGHTAPQTPHHHHRPMEGEVGGEETLQCGVEGTGWSEGWDHGVDDEVALQEAVEGGVEWRGCRCT